MSWTLVDNLIDPCLEDLKSAIKEAHDKNILMFSSASDQGSIDQYKNVYPACSMYVISIGAAKRYGDKSEWVGPKQAQYLCPGEDVAVEKNVLAEGSSIATALAAGLAALILHCVDIYCADPEIKTNKSDLRKTITKLDEIKRVFNHMQAGEDKYLRVFDFFGPEFGSSNLEWRDKGRKEFRKLIAKLFL